LRPRRPRGDAFGVRACSRRELSSMTKALTIAVLAFGLAYACLWWSFQRFYAPFGVSPQDVGLAPSGTSADLPGACRVRKFIRALLGVLRAAVPGS
jgi:hypothetical protein